MTRVQATGKAAYNYSVSSSSTAFIDAILSHGRNTPSRKIRLQKRLKRSEKKLIELFVESIRISRFFSSFRENGVLRFPSFDRMNSQILAGYLRMSDINKY